MTLETISLQEIQSARFEVNKMKMAVFGSSSLEENTGRYEEIVGLGKLLGKNNISIVSGGYGGSREAISRGAKQENAKTIGVTCASLELLFPEKKLNCFIDDEIKTASIDERIGKMIGLADAFTVLSGSSGTQLEWITAYEKMNSGFMPEKQIIFYKADARVKDFVQYLCEQTRNKKYLFHFADNVQEYENMVREYIGAG